MLMLLLSWLIEEVGSGSLPFKVNLGPHLVRPSCAYQGSLSSSSEIL